MTEPKSIEDQVKDIVAEKLKVDRDAITPEKSFTKDLGADSLDYSVPLFKTAILGELGGF